MLENHIGFCTKVHKKKENLDAESFLQTAFCEWFSGKKENIAKNYSMLPKDSLVSKDGVEADLERLRKLTGKENGGKEVRIVDSNHEICG